jgi:hypothetical protein
VLLPALGWGEKDGTVTNSERRISRQRAFLPAPGEARGDWDILCDVARRMGFAASISPARRRSSTNMRACPPIAMAKPMPTRARRVFNLSGLAGLDKAAYDAMAPIQWPVQRADGSIAGTARVLEDIVSPTPMAARASCRPHRARRPRRRGLPADPQHRPRARPVAHHDAHRQVRHAGQPHPRILHRHAPAGRAAVACAKAAWRASAAAGARWWRGCSMAAASRAAAYSCRSTGTASQPPTRA